MTALATRTRATTGDALLVPRRRARQDAGLLLGTALLLTGTLLALLAAPRLLDRTADEALRTAVAHAGADAGVALRGPAPGDGGRPGGAFEDLLQRARWIDGGVELMLPATAVGRSSPERTVLDARTGFETAGPDSTAVSSRLVTIGTPSDPAEPVRWVAGRVPEAADPGTPEAPRPPTVQVGLHVDTARALGVDPTIAPVGLRIGTRAAYHTVWVTGLYEVVDPDDPRWTRAPELLGPVSTPTSEDTPLLVGLYVVPEAVPDMARLMGTTRLPGTVLALPDVDRMTATDVPALRHDVVSFLAAEEGAASGLPAVLDAFDAHVGAARAQAALVLAGLGATAACCLVLAAALLVERRRSHLAGERARGASLASVALRGAVESLPLAALAAAVAWTAVTLWLPRAAAGTWLPVAVTLVAVAAPALLAARAAGTAWAGRRVPADRRERARIAGLRSARRLLVELVAVVVAVLALVALRGRGLVPAAGASADPLLTSTPFLLAVAASFVVVRVAPAVVRAVARWTTRTRGLAGPLAATRAQRAATSLLPLVSVTVAVALMVLCGVLVQNVRDGQELAADRLVGADVRLDGALEGDLAAAALDALRSAPGVTAVATGAQLTQRTIGRDLDLAATVLVVDAPELARVREAVGLPVDPRLDALRVPGGLGPDDLVPVLVDPVLLPRLDRTEGLLLQVYTRHVDTEVVGTTVLTPDGGAPPVDARAAGASVTGDDGVAVVDAATLAPVAQKMPPATRAWVAGPGAVQAVADLGLADLPGVTVTTRDGWYAQWSRAPIPGALVTLLLAAVGALALLAAIGLALVVVATSGERGRTLSTLRTLGLDARTARWATLGELAPLVVGGLLGGTVIGLVLPVLVGDALGLTWVTAAPGSVPVEPALWPVLLAAGTLGVALLVAVLVEQAVRRRENLGEVLRVGAR